jgi:outer membrane lipoprotein-sorting protein
MYRIKRILSILLATLFVLSLKAQTTQETAKQILDNAIAVFRANGGVKINFTVKMFSKNKSAKEIQGVIQLKGEKFLLKTNDAVTWFDGKTQWSYWIENGEVNITTPAAEELQSINPYALLSLYRNGFEYKQGATVQFQGKPVYELILKAIAKSEQNTSNIRLYIAKKSYQPVCMIMEQREGNRSEITVLNYQNRQKYDDTLFIFDKKNYPGVEIIDLR